MRQCCHNVLCYQIVDKIRTVYRGIVMKEKSTVGSPFFGAFPSDRNSKATEYVNVHFCTNRFTIRD